ncbi:chemotaxis protein [Aggregicoccus sp. 17bor-14]|uniref:chemotaxis protein n=1 Tax=Myxococcaceae TaxID=31 RepID=UPI00129D0719|nr:MULTISPECIES: chemotaxis protein [Myxococcaceae]MBF5044200.1 chemotaxis protein [Simulacricoccus sp. 17bor-14]MRI89950.1 chemotaxis protein [Aggregicoccus sp. 17bor-14]
MRPPLASAALRLAALAVGLALAGCATVEAPPSAALQKVGRSDLRPEELRIQVRALAPRFSGQLENLADDIARDAGDAPTRLAMTRFKANAIPAMQSALFQPDPVAAVVDAWALVAQLQDALVDIEAQTPGRARLATPAFAGMERELEAVWADLTGKQDTSQARARVHRWARDNPLRGSVSARTDTTALLAGLTAQSGVGALGTAGRLMDTTQDLVARMDLQTAFLPKQGRWQAELFTLGALQDPAYRDALPELPLLATALQEVTRQVQAVPWLMARERSAVLAGVRDERLGAQGFVTSEREALVTELRQERVAVLQEMDRTVQRAVDRSFDRAQALVDRMFLFALGLVLLAVLGALAVALLLRRRWSPREQGPPPRSGWVHLRRPVHG